MFGNNLDNAVTHFASNDGVKVPYPIRICIDVIEQKGEIINCDQKNSRI